MKRLINIIKKRLKIRNLKFIDKIQSNKNLNCFITETFEIALSKARESDEKLQKGKVLMVGKDQPSP